MSDSSPTITPAQPTVPTTATATGPLAQTAAPVDASPLIATASQTVGPFFGFALTVDASLGQMARPEMPGERMTLRVRVVDGDAQPVSDAIIELWHPVEAGGPAGQPEPTSDAGPTSSAGPTSGAGQMSIFGRLPTGEDGACEFHTVKPARIAETADGPHAAHISICLFARGLLRHLFTRCYFAGDPDLATDAVLRLVPEHRRSTLLAQPDGDGRWLFELRLQGGAETVFFDA